MRDRNFVASEEIAQLVKDGVAVLSGGTARKITSRLMVMCPKRQQESAAQGMIELCPLCVLQVTESFAEDQVCLRHEGNRYLPRE
jgi:hypothetical protein